MQVFWSYHAGLFEPPPPPHLATSLPQKMFTAIGIIQFVIKVVNGT